MIGSDRADWWGVPHWWRGAGARGYTGAWGYAKRRGHWAGSCRTAPHRPALSLRRPRWEVAMSVDQ